MLLIWVLCHRSFTGEKEFYLLEAVKDDVIDFGMFDV